MKTRYIVSALGRLEMTGCLGDPCDAAEFIAEIRVLRLTDKRRLVVIYARESCRSQASKLKRQIRELRRYVELLGYKVIAVFREVAPANCFDPESDRPAFRAACEVALAANAIVVLESRERAIRHRLWHPHRQNEILPTRFHYERLRNLTLGVTIATRTTPNATQTEIKSVEQFRRKLRKKDRTPGYKRRRRDAMRYRVFELKMTGLPDRFVAAETGVPVMTVNRWWKSRKGVVPFFSTTQPHSNEESA